MTVKYLRTLFLILPLLLSLQPARAQLPELIKNEQFRRDAQAAVDSLYNFNRAGARQRLSDWHKQYPDHPLWQLLDGMEFWWIILSDLNDHARDDRFFEMMKRADYAASKLLYEQPGHADALIIRTVANGYIARQYSNREEWVTSLNAARKAYNAYGALREVLPDFPDLRLAEGLKLYYSQYLPEAYPVVRTVSWFLPEGDKEKGLEQMRKAAETAVFARAESIYFLGNINYNYEERYDKAAAYFRRLYEEYPNNNYYVRLLVRNYYEMEQYGMARAVIDSALQRWDRQNIPFEDVLREELLFWKGRILYRDGHYEAALPLFRSSFRLSNRLPRSRHRDYYPASAYYSGLILNRQGAYREALQYLEAAQEARSNDRYRRLARQKRDAIRSAH